MIINGRSLINLAPVSPMPTSKRTSNGVSWGLTEAGIDIRIKQDVRLSAANRFVLASAIEEFDMPHNLVGVVHDKSTWARQGLSVFNTVIEPGWKGFLTLELVYHGNDDGIVIEAGTGIAQVLFHSIENYAAYSGKYQGQPDRPVAAIMEVALV